MGSPGSPHGPAWAPSPARTPAGQAALAGSRPPGCARTLERPGRRKQEPRIPEAGARRRVSSHLLGRAGTGGHRRAATHLAPHPHRRPAALRRPPSAGSVQGLPGRGAVGRGAAPAVGGAPARGRDLRVAACSAEREGSPGPAVGARAAGTQRGRGRGRPGAALPTHSSCREKSSFQVKREKMRTAE